MLLQTRLREFNRIAFDVGGGGDCFFRAVSHQLYGNPTNHFHVSSFGIQYLMHNPEQFIESNTDYSWQGFLNNMSCQGTWADAIIIQAVANCLNLSIHIAESNETFTPATVVEPVNVTTACTNIYIGHIGESHYVSTMKKENSQISDKRKSGQNFLGEKMIDKNKKRRVYMKEYMKMKTDYELFKRTENKNLRKEGRTILKLVKKNGR